LRHGTGKNALRSKNSGKGSKKGRK
jgi:hypothetical protein